MPEFPRNHHISSAVVSVLPAMSKAVLSCLSGMANVEVHGHRDGKIVVVLEGASTAELGDSLTRIASLDGVIAANMVFEHIEEAAEQ